MSTARNRDRGRNARRRPSGARIALIGVGLALVAGLTAFGFSRVSGSGHGAAATTVSYNAATKVLIFSLPGFAGGTIGSTQFAGKPLVVNFYASWCEVCSLEMPQFQATYLQLRDQVAFVGVNPQQGGSDTDAAQAAMVAQTGVTYPTARDAQNSLLAVFNTSGALPTTVFLDPSGRVVDAYNGGLTQSALRQHISRDFGIGA